MKLDIVNAQNEIRLDKAIRNAVTQAAVLTLEHEGVGSAVELALVFTDDDGIRKLNRRYRDIDTATDVLSFPNLEEEDISRLKAGQAIAKREPGQKAPYLGDVAISLPCAARQASEAGHLIQNEAAILMVHAVLHLLGYDHKAGKGHPEEMFSIQAAVLKDMGLSWRWEGI
ncbi:MAG: rRNA maturation RNase YbeY [Bacillota bacterium]|nr:rRNA maturation RNase YbeY [Bacillota bacterium]